MILRKSFHKWFRYISIRIYYWHTTTTTTTTTTKAVIITCDASAQTYWLATEFGSKKISRVMPWPKDLKLYSEVSGTHNTCHVLVFFSNEQGRIHRWTVACCWAGAVMQENKLFGLKSSKKVIKNEMITDRRTERRTNIVSYRAACTQLRMSTIALWNVIKAIEYTSFSLPLPLSLSLSLSHIHFCS